MEATQLSKSTRKTAEFSRFWTTATKEWVALNNKLLQKNHDRSFLTTLLEPLFNNKKTIHRGETLNFENWTKKGITHVIDFLTNKNIDTVTTKSLEDIKKTIAGDPRVPIQYNIIYNAIPKNMKCNLILKYNREQFRQATTLKQNINHNKAEQIRKLSNKQLRDLTGQSEGIQISGKEFWKKK